jgi:2-dehydro-3-deoxyphosphogluconate aldolase/(4S)-4-hydroxy-2-oxoglutarate aldolase
MSLSKVDVRLRIEEVGLVPSIHPRGGSLAADEACFAAEALNSGGVPVAEISMSVPGAINVISHIAKHFPKMVIGADLLDLETARRCLDAGARFFTSPGLLPDVVEFAVEKEVVVFPGALTPTEVLAASNAGADFVKVFPCSQVGGAAYIRALHAPLPHVPLIASGGVNDQTVANFIFAGAAALGIGTELVPQEAMRLRREAQIHELARRFLEKVRDARAAQVGPGS